LLDIVKYGFFSSGILCSDSDFSLGVSSVSDLCGTFSGVFKEKISIFGLEDNESNEIRSSMWSSDLASSSSEWFESFKVKILILGGKS
jgi:hypothetical protein